MNDGNRPKINSRSPTKYAPIEMCDDSVYDMAEHQYTLEQIAERFNVTKTTVIKLHGEAFQAGKFSNCMMPRQALMKIIKDFMVVDPATGMQTNFSRQDVPTGTLLKAIEIYWKKYEGLGQKTEVHHTGVGYDKVESTPNIIERPDED